MQHLKKGKLIYVHFHILNPLMEVITAVIFFTLSFSGLKFLISNGI